MGILDRAIGLVLSISMIGIFLFVVLSFRGIRKELKQLWKQVEVENGPFLRADIRFPRKLRRYEFSHEFVSQLHIHRMTPKKVNHLLHVLKFVSDIPASAMLYSAGLDMSRDVWQVTLMDDSFEEIKDHSEIPLASVAIETEVMRKIGPEHECPVCAMDKMANVSQAPR